jgi:hypothetical protein
MTVCTNDLALCHLVKDALPVAVPESVADSELLVSQVIELQHHRIALSAINAGMIAEVGNEILDTLGDGSFPALASRFIADASECKQPRGVAQSGSALGWGPSGRRFKSCLPDLVKRPVRMRPRRRAAHLRLLHHPLLCLGREVGRVELVGGDDRVHEEPDRGAVDVR